jgi:hypothetical protein
MGKTTYTSADKIPWECTETPDDKDYKAKWPELETDKVDPVQVAGDLYLTEGLANHLFIPTFDPTVIGTVTPMSKERMLEIIELLDLGTPLETALVFHASRSGKGGGGLTRLIEIASLAKQLQKYLVDLILPTFRAYAHGACGGELRYHPSVGSYKLPSNRSNAWVAWRDIYEKHGNDAIKLMSKLFNEMGGGSIGGPKWAVAADVLWQFETQKLGPTPESNNKVFIDRVLALQHNGGCFLNKRKWANYRTDRIEQLGSVYVSQIVPSGQMMVPVLDCHHANPPNISGLYSVASDGIRQLTTEYLDIAKKESIVIEGVWQNDKQAVTYTTQVKKAPAKKAPAKKKATKVVLPDATPVYVTISVSKVGSEWAGSSNWQDVNVSKTYKFTDSKEFGFKKFHLNHLIKSKYPGMKAKKMTVEIKCDGTVAVAEMENAWDLGSKYGSTLLNHAVVS